MNLNKKLSPVTFHYMIITGGFWMAFCVVTAYAAVYLQGIGCTNAELGLILALGNVGGALLSPVLGARIDRNRNLRHAAVINVLLAIQVLLLVVLRLHPRHDLLTAACYVLYMTAMMPVNAVNLDLCVRLERAKAPLNFGLARSMGSFSFVILSTLLGVITAIDHLFRYIEQCLIHNHRSPLNCHPKLPIKSQVRQHVLTEKCQNML